MTQKLGKRVYFSKVSMHQEECMGTPETIAIENVHMPPFFKKIPVSIDKGKGVYVWDEEENQYLDLTPTRVTDECLARRVFVHQTQGDGIRVFPALNVDN